MSYPLQYFDNNFLTGMFKYNEHIKYNYANLSDLTEDGIYYIFASRCDKVLNDLIKQTYFWNYINDFRQNILHISVIYQCEKLVKHLVENNLVDINSQDFLGRTPVYFAAALNNFNIVKYLVENGAIINYSTTEGISPLQIAAINDKFDNLNYLVKMDPRNVSRITINQM
ncbi:MAG: ankyrin repeat domain-containing protein [Rickettsia endosymbiont of Ixodes persulcatus]|nr:ankyrin repeat domain-containing protein [Rickettsia endosymbiont of Ixodes persulcatus]